MLPSIQHELSIIAQDIPLFREVAGDRAFYFDGDTPSSLTNVIKDWIQLYRSNTHPKSNSMPWLTWAESTRILKCRVFESS